MPVNGSSARLAPSAKPASAPAKKESSQAQRARNNKADAESMESTFPIVFDNGAGTHSTAMTVATTILGYTPKLKSAEHAVPPGPFDNLGTVKVAMVPERGFKALKEKFDFTSIGVWYDIGNHEVSRTAYIPEKVKASRAPRK